MELKGVSLWNVLFTVIGFLDSSVVKNPPGNTEDVDLIKEGRKWQLILGWEIPWLEEPGWLVVMGSQKSWTRLSD